jgi:hypothetical protein
VPADFQRRARFERRFPADLAGDHQPAGLIHGSDHGRMSTTTWNMKQETLNVELFSAPGLSSWSLEDRY